MVNGVTRCGEATPMFCRWRHVLFTISVLGNFWHNRFMFGSLERSKRQDTSVVNREETPSMEARRVWTSFARAR
jgi:hypothetical protein